MLLGLSKAKLLAAPTTAHFLLGEGCVNDCAFCAQAKNSHSLPRHLSRVVWPKYSWGEIEIPLSEAIENRLFSRICIQTVECSQGTALAMDFVRKVRGISRQIPISVCAAPYSLARVEAFFRAGASTVGLPLDAATPEIHGRVKRGLPNTVWRVLRDSSKRWPGRISTHFIAGLGETEEELVRAIAEAQEYGVTVGLFSFTPVRGTDMEAHMPPDVSRYRRVQLAAYFLKRGGTIGAIKFAQGKISHICLDNAEIRREIGKGLPFMTSGCPGCNRPYYNERPGQVMMNYPVPLSAEEASRCIYESGLSLGSLELTLKEANLGES